jgi:hypothetical protein
MGHGQANRLIACDISYRRYFGYEMFCGDIWPTNTSVKSGQNAHLQLFSVMAQVWYPELNNLSIRGVNFDIDK